MTLDPLQEKAILAKILSDHSCNSTVGARLGELSSHRSGLRGGGSQVGCISMLILDTRHWTTQLLIYKALFSLSLSSSIDLINQAHILFLINFVPL